ncbi:MAG: translation initiation factor IF-3 [Deltaproteobacteria bacterium]|nr:translation initiation factor IF-3 [Deltaproteobacteria bacterium]
MELRVNRRIRIPEVRLIGANGDQLGVFQTIDAMRKAEEAGLDLVEISPTARPPVCKIMDYGKYKYEQAKRQHEAKKHQAVVHLKEVKMRPVTDQHDFEIKLRHIKRFLTEGDKAKVTVQFRGREMAHRERGHEMLKRVVVEVGPAAVVEQYPRFEGRFLSLVLAPMKK